MSVPEGWRKCKLFEIFDIINGRPFKPHEWSDTGLPIIRIQNINGSKEYNYYQGNFDEKVLIKKGQLLFAWSGSKGSSFGPHIWNSVDGLLNYHTWRMNVKSSCSKEFLFHFLKKITSEIESKTQGASALVHIPKERMETFVIQLPPLAEQKKIAAILSTWDKAIEATDKLLENARQQKKALMQQLLTGKERLPGFEGEWAIKKINNISSQVHTKSDGNQYPILTISSLRRFVTQEEKYSRYMAGESIKNYTLLKKGEFAYNKGNSKTYQYGCVFDLYEYESGLVPNVYVCFKLNHENSIEFFRYMFEADCLHNQLEGLVNTGVRNNGLLNIKPKDFFNTYLLCPSPPEQQAIARVLTTADKEIDALTQKAALLRQEKRALMQQLLTGKKRVRVEA